MDWVRILQFLQVSMRKSRYSIYQVATMDTIAKANALQKIMGQDGYVKGEGPLKH